MNRPSCLALLLSCLLILSPSGASSQPLDDAFGDLKGSSSADQSPRSGDSAGGAGGPTLDSMRQQRLRAAQIASSAIENSNDATAVPALNSALTSLLALISQLENDLGLRSSGEGLPFYSYDQGLEKASLLNQSYQTAGQIYEDLHRRTYRAGAADKSKASGAIKYYWQAAATGYFQLRKGNWEKRIFPDIARDPVLDQLQTQGKSAVALLNGFVVNLTRQEFSEARSDALRGRRGIMNALRSQIEEGYSELSKTPRTLATDFGQRLAARDSSKSQFMAKQEAAEAIALAYYRMGQEFESASASAQGDEDMVLALQQFQLASNQIYWARTKRFRLKEAQVQALAKSLLATVIGDNELAKKLAGQTGLPEGQVQQALNRFSEELVKFIRIPGASRETVSEEMSKLDPAELEALLLAAQRDDERAFFRVASRLKLLEKTEGREEDEPDRQQQLKELLAKLKQLLNRDTIPYGFWVAVTGTPERAREMYFRIVKQRFELDVNPLASTVAAENFIRGLQIQGGAAGIGPDAEPGAQNDFLQLKRLEREALSALVDKDEERAIRAFSEADAIFQRLSEKDSDYFKDSEAAGYKTSFSQLRSRMYLAWADMSMDQARVADRSSQEYQDALVQALMGYFTASDEYPMRAVEKVRGNLYRRRGGDTRLPTFMVDSLDTAGKDRVHSNSHAVFASKKLNTALEQLVLGTDPEFSAVVEKITRGILAIRSGDSLVSRNPDLDITEEFKNKISKLFGENGLIIFDPKLSDVSREILELLYSSAFDTKQRRAKIRTVVTRVARGGTVDVVAQVAHSMEEQTRQLLRSSEEVDPGDLDNKERLEQVLRDWDGKLSKAAPNAQALNEIFFSIATKFRHAAQLADSEARQLVKTDESSAKQKQREAKEKYLNAMRFYFMASKKVFYGNERTFAFELPEWDVSLLLAYRAFRLVRHEAPALMGTASSWVNAIFKAPAGSRLVFVKDAIQTRSGLWLQGARTLIQEGAKAPVKMAGRGIAAAGRGIFGHARTPAGKLLSLGGLAFFVWMNYAHNIELEENRIIILQDTSRAEEAKSAFWDLVRSRAVPRPVAAAPK